LPLPGSGGKIRKGKSWKSRRHFCNFVLHFYLLFRGKGKGGGRGKGGKERGEMDVGFAAFFPYFGKGPGGEGKEKERRKEALGRCRRLAWKTPRRSNFPSQKKRVRGREKKGKKEGRHSPAGPGRIAFVSLSAWGKKKDRKGGREGERKR